MSSECIVAFLFFLHKYHPIKMFSRALSMGWRGSASRFDPLVLPGMRVGLGISRGHSTPLSATPLFFSGIVCPLFLLLW